MKEAVKERIMEATIQIFNRKGAKFTMDDVAKELGMSKKTIYTVFRDKETLFYETVDYCFDSIKESELKVLENDSLNTVEKIRAVLGVLPEGYQDINFSQLYSQRDKYPQIYKLMEERLETGWERTISLLEQGMEEGCIRRIEIPVLKTMLEATLEQFLQRDVLIRNGIPYKEALKEVVSILVDGIAVRTK